MTSTPETPFFPSPELVYGLLNKEDQELTEFMNLLKAQMTDVTKLHQASRGYSDRLLFTVLSKLSEDNKKRLIKRLSDSGWTVTDIIANSPHKCMAPSTEVWLIKSSLTGST